MGAPGLYDLRVRLAALLLIAACGPDEGDPAFAFLGEVADQRDRGSVIGLFTVTTPVAYTFKFGSGSATPLQFGLEFLTDPPAEAIDGNGIGVALVGELPGLSAIPDGEVDVDALRLIGLSTDTAVVFKTEAAAGPAWATAFPTGFSCGRCVRVVDGPDELEPVNCTFVVIERAIEDPCVWY
jgi:hypothetical protein